MAAVVFSLLTIMLFNFVKIVDVSVLIASTVVDADLSQNWDSKSPEQAGNIMTANTSVY